MSAIRPEIEIVDRSASSIRYLEHGWPTNLCRWHAHDEYELHLITCTRGKTLIGDYIGDFESGSLFLTGPRLPHNWITVGKEFDPVDVRDMLIQFSHDGLAGIGEAYPEFRELEPLLAESRRGVEFIGFDSREAKARLAEIGESSGCRRVLLSLDFLLELSRWPGRNPLSVNRVGRKQSTENNPRIAEVIDYIVANHAEQLTLSRFAGMVDMSESAFSRFFRATTGHRFTEFVNRIRVGQACIRLYETDDSVASVSLEVGFRNTANFHRQFLKIKGMTPSAFRNDARKEQTGNALQGMAGAKA